MNAPTRTKVAEQTESRSIAVVFAALMLVMLLASLSQTVLSTALPTIVGALDGADQMLWVITAYLLSSTIMMPIYGRLSDQYGRKSMLLVAIFVFTAGSLLGALAWDMPTLIGARVVQGFGGGGLMVLSQAAIADVVPARDRGKYVGILGAAFAVSSVAGPLLGGWFTEGPGWRWTFWINVPLGALAFAVTAWLLHIPRSTKERGRSDYLGMMFLAFATTTLILATTWGGHRYDWLSMEIIALGVATVLSAVAFLWAESRAAEPIIPLSLFKDRNFNLTTVGVIATGVAMFGSLSYLPTYLQMSTGASPTMAGLMMISMMAGLLISSVASGIIVSRTGHYRIFPIMGAVGMIVGLFLMSTITVGTPDPLVQIYMAIFGVGIGLGMQVMTLIVQNSVDYSIVGTATAATNYFRQVGGTLGSAVVGSVFTSRLLSTLENDLPQSSTTGGPSSNSLTPEAINQLPPALRDIVVEAYNNALMPIFLAMVPLIVVALVALWFVVETPLSLTVDGSAPGEEPGAPEEVAEQVTESAEVMAGVAAPGEDFTHQT